MTDSPTRKRNSPATAMEVNALRAPGRHSIGGGLILVVNAGGARSWLARIRDATGRRRDIGLGSYPEVSLAAARARVAEMRQQVRAGLDPVAEKRNARDGIPTFKAAAEAVHAERKGGFRNTKHAAQWINTIREYANPSFGHVPVDKITVAMIVVALKKIWLEKPETARRVLQRVGTVIAWSVAHGHREHEASMQAIRMGLPPQPKGVKHHPAVPYQDAPAAMRRLLDKPESAARQCLRFLILTGARSGEARGARWSEIDMEARTWTIPPDRIKMEKEHIVPLSDPAFALVKALYAVRGDDRLFPALRTRRNAGNPDAVMSDVALSKAHKEVAPGTTVHGWRSTFRDWGAEETTFQREVLEKALAHQIENAVERAYRRGDLLEKRRQAMTAWANYLAGLPANVSDIAEARERAGA